MNTFFDDGSGVEHQHTNDGLINMSMPGPYSNFRVVCKVCNGLLCNPVVEPGAGRSRVEDLAYNRGYREGIGPHCQDIFSITRPEDLKVITKESQKIHEKIAEQKKTYDEKLTEISAYEKQINTDIADMDFESLDKIRGKITKAKDQAEFTRQKAITLQQARFRAMRGDIEQQIADYHKEAGRLGAEYEAAARHMEELTAELSRLDQTVMQGRNKVGSLAGKAQKLSDLLPRIRG